MKDHKLSGLKITEIYHLSSKDQKSEIKVLAVLVPSVPCFSSSFCSLRCSFLGL